LASLGVSLEGRSSSQGDSVDLELRLCVSEGTLSELDLAHVSKCALGRQHNVNHISSLNLSNACMKSLAYHLRAQRHYTYLLYKAEETNRITYWANTHKKRKVSSEDHSSHVYEGIWSRDVQS
jgi:hypothetical protein